MVNADELEYVVKYKNELLNIQSNIKKHKPNKVLIFFSILFIALLSLIGILIGFKVEVSTTIAYLLPIGALSCFIIVVTALIRDLYRVTPSNWNLNIKERKMIIKKGKRIYEIDFEKIVDICDEKYIQTRLDSDDINRYFIYQQNQLKILYLSDKNDIVDIILPYERDYGKTIFGKERFEIYADKKDIENLMNYFITNKKLEENKSFISYEKYFDIRSKEEEQSFKEIISKALTKSKIYNKKDIYAIIFLIVFIIYVIVGFAVQGILFKGGN